jgi:SAM-dependent methyltransferase
MVIIILSCISCGGEVFSVAGGYRCNRCEKNYPLNEGVGVFMSDEPGDVNSYPLDSFDCLRKVEDTYFWFLGRNLIIKSILAKFLPSRRSKVLEVGCGTGYVSALIKSMGYELDCADILLESLKSCRLRLKDSSFFQFDLYNIPFRGHFDCICAFDVIEHVENDRLALRNIGAALKPKGFLFITVPAYSFLWSKSDDYACHKRRYNSKELESKLMDAGFDILKKSHFMTFLLPFVILSRLLLKNEIKDEFSINPILNQAFLYSLILESYLINHIDLPLGSSIFIVARQKEVPCL